MHGETPREHAGAVLLHVMGSNAQLTVEAARERNDGERREKNDDAHAPRNTCAAHVDIVAPRGRPHSAGRERAAKPPRAAEEANCKRELIFALAVGCTSDARSAERFAPNIRLIVLY